MALVGTSRLLKYTDTSAPAIGASAGALINVLKKALVDGYGSTISLGWTLEFEDTARKIAVFKSGGGTRKYIRVDDSGVIWSKVEVYSNMTTIDEGSEKVAASAIYIYKNFSWTSYIYTNIDCWHIIGDEQGFWLHVGTVGLLGGVCPASHIVYIGDFNTFDPSFSNKFCTTLSLEIYLGTAYRWPTQISEANPYCVLLSNTVNGSFLPHYGMLSSPLTGLFGNNKKINGSSLFCLGYPINILSQGTIVGQLPGVVNAYNKFVDGTEFTNERLAYLIKDGNYNDIAFSCITGTGYGTTQYDSSRVPQNASLSQRITIKIGDGFRNVY